MSSDVDRLLLGLEALDVDVVEEQQGAAGGHHLLHLVLRGPGHSCADPAIETTSYYSSKLRFTKIL